MATMRGSEVITLTKDNTRYFSNPREKESLFLFQNTFFLSI